MSHARIRRGKLDGELTLVHQAAPGGANRLQTSADYGSAEVAVNGWLLWGFFLPVLLVVAGVITLRRRNRRR